MMKNHRKIAVHILLLAAVLSLICGCESKPEKNLNLVDFYAELTDKYKIPEMVEISPRKAELYYGIDVEKCCQLLLRRNMDGQSVDEVWLIQTANAPEAERLLKTAQSRMEQICRETENYFPDRYAVARKGKAVSAGKYVGLFVSEQADEMAEEFLKQLK